MFAYTPIYRCKMVREGSVPTEPRLDSSAKARAVANALLSDSPCEQLIAILLDTKQHVIGVAPVTQGTLNASLAHPREMFRAAIIANAAAIVLAHNHPSGDLQPSQEDWDLFGAARKAGVIMGIDMLDSIIVDGLGQTLSLAEEASR